MDVELLVVADCPNGTRAAALLCTALRDVGLGRVEITTTVITSPEHAGRRGFTGSPTILIDGNDPFPEPTNRRRWPAACTPPRVGHAASRISACSGKHSNGRSNPTHGTWVSDRSRPYRWRGERRRSTKNNPARAMTLAARIR